MILLPKDIGVVVVTYRRPKSLSKTVQAILNQGILEDQIWVINNDPDQFLNPKDINPDLTEIRIENLSENIASAGGFSLGMELVAKKGFDWVLLFNDDSRPISGSLESLSKALEGHESSSLGLVKIANKNSEGLATLLNWKGVRVPSYIPISDELVKTDLVTFDGCLISCQMIREIGTCDPKYFMGTYEFEYCLRARDHNYRIFTLPNGMIEDEKLGSMGGTPPWRQYYNTRNHLYLGLYRRDFQIIWAWMVREMKFTYAILRWEDSKRFRLQMKALATWHAVIGKRGKILDQGNIKR